MQYKELPNYHKIVTHTVAATGNTPGIDLLGMEQLTILLSTGAVGTSVDAVIEDSDDNITFAVLDPTQAFTQIVVADQTAIAKVKVNTSGPVAIRRYVRVALTIVGVSQASVTLLAANLSGHLPETNPIDLDVNNVSV